MANVDRENFGRAALQQTIGEATSRRADVECGLTSDLDAEKIERAREFERAPTCKLPWLGNGNRRLDINQFRRFRENMVPHPDFAGHDCALRAFAALKKPALDQCLIDSRLFFHCCWPINLSTDATSSADARRR